MLKSSCPPGKKDEPAPAPNLILEVTRGKGKEPGQLVLRREEKDGDRIAVAAPAAGWHDVALSWEDGKVTFTLDGKAAGGTLSVTSMNIPAGTGPEMQRTAQFIFGGPGNAAITAIDDLATYRTAAP